MYTLLCFIMSRIAIKILLRYGDEVYEKYIRYCELLKIIESWEESMDLKFFFQNKDTVYEAFNLLMQLNSIDGIHLSTTMVTKVLAKIEEAFEHR